VVIWTPSARADLKAIYDYIARTAPINARQVINDIRLKADSQIELPLAGKIIPELNDESLREVHAHSWRIFYQVRSRDMFVIAVIHKRRQLADADIHHLIRDEANTNNSIE
jgi:plasmid stabilization system protein ParE